MVHLSIQPKSAYPLLSRRWWWSLWELNVWKLCLSIQLFHIPSPVLSLYMLGWFLPSPYSYVRSFPSVILHFHPHVLQLCIVPSPHPSSFLARCLCHSAAARPTRTPGMRRVLLPNTTPSFRASIVVPRIP